MFDDAPTPNLPATLRRLSDIVAEYDEKAAAIPETIDDLKRAATAAEMASTVGGEYIGQIWSRGGSPSLHESTIRANLLQSAWQHVYKGLNLDRIAPASDRSRFDLALKNPAPFTLDNIKATFGHYISDPRAHILRGLAECFAHLDQAFKSHDRMKVGVAGLPKRIILSSVTDAGCGGWGTERLGDTLKALCVLLGLPQFDFVQLRALLDDAKKGPAKPRELIQATPEEKKLGIYDRAGEHMAGPIGDLTLKRFANGNAHLFFGPQILLTVNRALAEYYGDVLPDCPEERPKKATGTAVAKDLQFYRTPAAVADQLVARAGIRSGMRILEPSCGDGAILEALRRHAVKERIDDVRATGIEVDPGRAEAARAKGFGVHVGNFLQTQPNPVFDVVLMNPPFYGKHYQKHVEHARKFLKPGGRVLAILPITAATDHGFVTIPKWGRDTWEDLPVGSFSESGTNINTGIAHFFAPDL
jgi:SAM-dependent methyltransferase